EGGIAVAGKGDRPSLQATLSIVSDCTGAYQLVAPLGPVAVAAREDPPRAEVLESVRVIRPAQDRGIAVSRKGDRVTLTSSGRTGPAQFVARRGPVPFVAGEAPRRAGVGFVARTADDGGVAVAGEGDRLSLLRRSDRTRADELV